MLSTITRIRPGFNNGSTIDLDSPSFTNLKQTEMKAFDQCKFLNFGFVDLNAVDIEDEQFWNIGVRNETCADEERVESLMTSFLNHGYMQKFWPAAVDTDCNWLDGRGRAIAAKNNGERFLPVAVYSRTNTSVRNTVTNGLRGNNHPPAASARFNDFIAAGIRLVAEGELNRTQTDIETWLYNEVGINQWYSTTSGASIVAKIVNKIIKMTNLSNNLIVKRERSEWEKWIKKNLGLKPNEYALIKIDQQTYRERLWCRHVLPNIRNHNSYPTKVILYTGADTASEAREYMKTFLKEMKNLRDFTYELMEVNHDITYSENKRKSPYNILGAVPQIKNVHRTTGISLVPVSNY